MSAQPLYGLHFCITGEFGETRSSIVNKLVALGAVWHSSVTRKVNLLIVGTDPGRAKIRKAGAMNISITNREWLVRALALGGYLLGAAKIEVENV